MSPLESAIRSGRIPARRGGKPIPAAAESCQHLAASDPHQCPSLSDQAFCCPSGPHHAHAPCPLQQGFENHRRSQSPGSERALPEQPPLVFDISVLHQVDGLAFRATGNSLSSKGSLNRLRLPRPSPRCRRDTPHRTPRSGAGARLDSPTTGRQFSGPPQPLIRCRKTGAVDP